MVRAESRRPLLDVGADGKAFVLQAQRARAVGWGYFLIGFDVPVENVVAWFEEIRDFDLSSL